MNKIIINNKGKFLNNFVEVIYLKDSFSGNIKKGQKSKISYNNYISLKEKGIVDLID